MQAKGSNKRVDARAPAKKRWQETLSASAISRWPASVCPPQPSTDRQTQPASLSHLQTPDRSHRPVTLPRPPIPRPLPHAAKMRFCNFSLSEIENSLQKIDFAPLSAACGASRSKMPSVSPVHGRLLTPLCTAELLAAVQNCSFAADFCLESIQKYKTELLQ